MSQSGTEARAQLDHPTPSTRHLPAQQGSKKPSLTQGRPCKVPLVLQISMRFTTFSCLSSWRILISRKAVMGNWKRERENVDWRCRRPGHLCLENRRGVTMQLGRSCPPLLTFHIHTWACVISCPMIQPSSSCRTASLAVAFAVQGVNSLPNP